MGGRAGASHDGERQLRRPWRYAHGTCNLIYFHIKGGKTELAAVGGYRDELRKVEGDWRFAHRKVYVDK